MAIRVPYREFREKDGTKLYWILFNVQLAQLKPGSPQTRNAECVIDSGATTCLFDSTLADALGLDLKSGVRQRMTGIGGQEEIWLHDVMLHIPGGPVQITACFKENLGIGGLLGLNGFFEHFVITFDPALKVCTLDRIHKA